MSKIEVSVSPGVPIRLTQCLFGYQDGHRLLAASRRFPEDVASLLLVHSDLAQGSTGAIDGYWTGIPVPAIKCYALMKTWSAPEMPRPGCVWTQVLLIANADIARFESLEGLKALFFRPDFADGYRAYEQDIVVDPTVLPANRRLARANSEEALRILRAVYASKAGGIVSGEQVALEQCIFATWSQQWPRLRRSFSFRTAVISSSASVASMRFDVGISNYVDGRREELHQDGLVNIDSWEVEALKDLESSSPTQYRRFLWRYGADMRRGRDAFRLLGRLFSEVQNVPRLEGQNLSRILGQVFGALTDPLDGRLLKDDLLSCGRNEYTLLPPGDPLRTLDFMLQWESTRGLPARPVLSQQAVIDLWESRREELLGVAQRAVELDVSAAMALVQGIALVAAPSIFWASTEQYSDLRKAAVRANPSLLDCDDIFNLDDCELLTFLEYANQDSDLISRLINRAVLLDRYEVAKFFAERNIFETARGLILGIENNWTKESKPVGQKWIGIVREITSEAERAILFEQLVTTNELAAYIRIFIPEVTEGTEIELTSWINVRRRLKNTAKADISRELDVYIFCLATIFRKAGCEILFESTFGAIHDEIVRHEMSEVNLESLSRYLPAVYWWQQWDTGFRLRKAVVDTYIQANLDPKSFLRLASENNLWPDFLEIASNTYDGYAYIRRIGYEW